MLFLCPSFDLIAFSPYLTQHIWLLISLTFSIILAVLSMHVLSIQANLVLLICLTCAGDRASTYDEMVQQLCMLQSCISQSSTQPCLSLLMLLAGCLLAALGLVAVACALRRVRRMSAVNVDHSSSQRANITLSQVSHLLIIWV